MRDADRCRGEDPYRITALVTRAQQPSTLSCCKAGITYFVLLFQPRAPRGARGELSAYSLHVVRQTKVAQQPPGTKAQPAVSNGTLQNCIVFL